MQARDNRSPDAVPAVSVVMPVLDGAATVRSALASLAPQDAAYELILVDGGSVDDTVAIAQSAPHLRLIVAPGSSIYQAINRGIAEARAPLIVLLNADDWLEPAAMSAWIEGFARAPSAEIVRGRVLFVEQDASGGEALVDRMNARAAGPLTVDLLLRGPCAINSLCMKRTVFERIGYFDAVYRLAADRDWMLRARIAGIPMVEIDRPVYRYLSHPGSSTLDRERRNFGLIRREHLAIVENYLGARAPAPPADLAAALLRWYAADTGMLAVHLARAGQWRELVAATKRAFRFSPAWPLRLPGEFFRWLMFRWGR